MKLALTLALAFSLTACALPPQGKTVQRLPFNEAEYAALQKTGNGVLRGQVFARQRGGSVIKGAGSLVLLNPVTSLSQQWLDETLKGNKMAEEMDPRYEAAGRVIQADADGRFQFDNVPAGDYFVVSSVEWEAVNQFGTARQGGEVVNKVRVDNDRVTETMLAR